MNADASIHGILVQLPLPAELSDAEQEIADMIALATEKNVGESYGSDIDNALYNQFLAEVEEKS